MSDQVPRLSSVPDEPRLHSLGEPFAADLVCVPLSFLKRVLAVVEAPETHRQDAAALAAQLESFLRA